MLAAHPITGDFDVLTGFALGTGYLKRLFQFPPAFGSEIVTSGDKEVLRLTFLRFVLVFKRTSPARAADARKFARRLRALIAEPLAIKAADL